ncbi:hypothetical protein G3480_09380 [Thiorhodococcus mannitoliphagus]|uniref:DUF2232 domain-containing protein n=1 Tax=Thiorhodococcus mannitoliphagus TaxID=329406 RepID=A0A6P1DR54_9GAMM|nr:hypothetical protein [Thiorhodococcus mannitoliphagus]NEX20518.1 hypothetical protein [Thiorhodococcus mannitoliphagus]
MKPIASFIMRGYSQATLVVTASALLSLLFPLFGLISSGAVGLVTLRNGPRAGGVVVALAALATALISTLALGAPLVAIGVAVVLWIPIWGLAAILRATRALGFTAQLAGLGGLVIVMVVHLLVGDPSVYWQQLMEPLRESLVKDGLIELDASRAVFEQLSKWMTGAFAAGLVLQYLLSLFIARWWQAQLYNPGGFGQEFRGLSIGRLAGLLFLMLLAWVMVAGGGGAAADLMPVLGVLMLLQGLAVVHCLGRFWGLHHGWLAGLYVLLVFFMPQVSLLLASVGLVDTWADIRTRIAHRAPGGD